MLSSEGTYLSESTLTTEPLHEAYDTCEGNNCEQSHKINITK
jgi:hypothetical protein